MNRVLSAINTHGVRGERVDDEVLLYIDEHYSGKFLPKGSIYEFAPTTMARLDITKLARIKAALEKANRARFREQA